MPGETDPRPLGHDEFLRVDARVGTVREALAFPEARTPAWRLRIDFGPEIGERWSSARLTALYTLDDLIGRQVIAVVNFPPKQIGPHGSHCLVLGLPDANGDVVLLAPQRSVPDGGRVH